jgi:hypothetical protein
VGYGAVGDGDCAGFEDGAPVDVHWGAASERSSGATLTIVAGAL